MLVSVVLVSAAAFAEDGGVFTKTDTDTFLKANSGDANGKGGLGVRGNGPASDQVNGPRPPSEAPKSVTVMGSLDKGVIRDVVVKHLDQMRACAAGDASVFSGRVVVKFVISPTGAVSTSSLTSSPSKSPQVDECVVKAVRTLQFPPPKGGGVVMVNFPFVFPL